ncbi:MAG: hypothetical protein IPM34_13145 [Saprospiraceae bacterium]|nr:hypothetical protein [Saprospiraceae bacterium]
MIVGNKSEKICKTSYEKADSLFKANKQQLPYLSAVDMRGLDSDIISQADSNTQEFYQKFNLRIKEKKFFQPDADCAEYYYGLLTANSQISKLHLTIKRNYAAALQDEVQQYVNHLLKADVKIIECQGFKSFLPNAAYLKRAKELLGSSHYMYRLLLARELLCQGIAFSFEKDNAVSLDSALYFLSLARELEPENPVVYYFMQRIFVYRQMVDSANYYQNICHQLAPEWILPYTGVVGELITNPDLKNLGESWMKQAAAIDSLHPHISHFNAWLLIEEGKYLEAAEQMNLYLKRGGETYACWYGTLGNIYYNLRGKEKEAEAAFLKAIELDNTRPIFYYNLAMVNMIIYENERSDSFMKKAILLEPNNPQWKIAMNWNYMYMGKFNEAELLSISEFKITGDTIGLWNDLCKNYLLTEKYNLVDSITLLMDQAGKFKYTSLRRKAQNEFCRNNIPSAYDYFSKVYRDKPKDKVSCIYLAYLDWLSGDHELSRDKIGKYFINGFDVAIVEKDIEFKMLRRKSNWIEFNNYLLQIRNEIGNK